VGAGGWNAVQKLSSDPKAELVSLVVSSLKNSGGQIDTTEGGKVDALLGLLYSRGKGYDSSLVDGDWRLVLSREGQKPPKIQKLVDKKAKVNTAENFFDVDSGIFSGINYTPRGNGKLKSAVKVRPPLFLELHEILLFYHKTEAFLWLHFFVSRAYNVLVGILVQSRCRKF